MERQVTPSTPWVNESPIYKTRNTVDELGEMNNSVSGTKMSRCGEMKLNPYLTS